MKTQHTPGPWTVDDNGFIYDYAGNTIADPHCSDIDLDEREANARLIAAAPELLNALERLYNAIDSCVELTPDLLQEVKSVIKKAK